MLSFLIILHAQTENIKCYPTNWWTGMKWNRLQVMVHGDKIANNLKDQKSANTFVKRDDYLEWLNNLSADSLKLFRTSKTLEEHQSEIGFIHTDGKLFAKIAVKEGFINLLLIF